MLNLEKRVFQLEDEKADREDDTLRALVEELRRENEELRARLERYEGVEVSRLSFIFEDLES